MIVSLMLAAAAATIPSERISVDHAGRTLAANYRAETRVAHKQVGAHAGTRMGTRRCDWTASVRVHRDVSGQDGAAIPALSRTLPAETRFSGSRMGECDTARDAIAAEVAGRDDRVRAHLADAMQQDRTALLAELDSVGPATAARAR